MSPIELIAPGILALLGAFFTVSALRDILAGLVSRRWPTTRALFSRLGITPRRDWPLKAGHDAGRRHVARMAITESSSGAVGERRGRTAWTKPLAQQTWIHCAIWIAGHRLHDQCPSRAWRHHAGVQHGAPGTGLTTPAEGNLTADDADRAIHNAIVPGCYIVPNGFFVVSRAQKVGCAYFSPS